MCIKASNNEFRRENTESNECTKRKLIEIVCEISINKFLFGLSVNMLKISPIIPPIQWKRFIAFDCILCVSLIWRTACWCLEIFLSHSLYVAVVVVCVGLLCMCFPIVFAQLSFYVNFTTSAFYWSASPVPKSSTKLYIMKLYWLAILVWGVFINEMFVGFVFCLYYL